MQSDVMRTDVSNRPILVPGDNCWAADAAAESCGLLVDGRAYYKAFYHAAQKARNSIFIAGWKFATQARLLRGEDVKEATGEVVLLPFLKALCETNPDLHIYMLAWDFSQIYMLEWEWFIQKKFNEAHPRIAFRFDAEHAIGGSHHHKLVVIDGHMAFMGGLDLNSDDWDDRDHQADNPERADSERGPRGPYHDIQACLTGPAAGELASFFAKRWEEAGHGPLNLPPPVASAAVPCGLTIKSKKVALSANQPKTSTHPEPVMQIKKLYTDAIAAANELIYLENQYFSSDAVGEAFEKRLKETDRPLLDIVLILPRKLTGWLESLVMEPPRLHWLDTLSALAKETGHRLGVYYTVATAADGTEVPTLVHSKLLCIDDRFLTVGSANTSNRSMGLDTELNASWEGFPPADKELTGSIHNVRVNLLAEHCGFLESGDLPKGLHLKKGLVDFLDHLVQTKASRLRQLTHEAIVDDRILLNPMEKMGVFLDPDSPLIG